MRRKENREGAFTLVELLCVIAILTLLVSMLLPTLSGAREIARRAKCMDQYRQLGAALHGFAATHNERGPGYGFVFNDKTNPVNWVPQTSYLYNDMMMGPTWMLEYEYFQTSANATPMIPSALPTRASGMEVRKKQLACPSARLGWQGGMYEFMINTCIEGSDSYWEKDNASGVWLLEGKWGVRVDPPPVVPNHPGLNWTVYTLGPRLPDFANPADQFAMWEAECIFGYPDPDIYHEKDSDQGGGLASNNYADTFVGQNPTMPPWDDGCGTHAFRHYQMTGVYLFIDGHVDALGTKDRILDPLRYYYRN